MLDSQSEIRENEADKQKIGRERERESESVQHRTVVKQDTQGTTGSLKDF